MPVGWQDLAPHAIAAVLLVVDVVASGHVLLRKRDARAAIAWVGFIWLVPLVGALLYLFFGVNRIQRRAAAVLRDRRRIAAPAARGDAPALVVEVFGATAEPLLPLARLGDRVVVRPLVRGNAVAPLLDGDQAYPAMLDAIDAATRSVALCTYIFDNDAAGARFRDALARARARGVETRVLIDDIGARYSFPPIDRDLRRAGVRVARFLPTLVPSRLIHFNLRNHRKILVVDGRIGFTGGMNIRVGHVRGDGPRHPTRDVHFRVEGPVVGQLMDAFAEDWAFATGEVLDGPAWYAAETDRGPVLARGITDGPDDDFDVLRTIMLGALTAARQRIRVVTPYFVPDQQIITALRLASLRGVEVDVVLPARGNLRVVQWAAMAQLWQVLERGCRVHLTPPPFDHTKLLVVDGLWTLVGSTNWDARSLRLNFEFNVECWDPALAARCEALVDALTAEARPITLADVDGRSLPVRLRDGAARLLSPYL